MRLLKDSNRSRAKSPSVRDDICRLDSALGISLFEVHWPRGLFTIRLGLPFTCAIFFLIVRGIRVVPPVIP